MQPPPSGYRVKDGKLVVDEEGAAHVRRIFARFTEIGSSTVLAREVGARGLGASRGNRIDNKHLSRSLRTAPVSARRSPRATATRASTTP